MSKNFYELRAFPNGKDQYNEFKKGNFAAIGWPEVPDITLLSSSEIREILTTNHPDYEATKIGQIVGFFDKLKHIKKGDIILIPYFNDEGPIITIAQVTEPYHYVPEYSDLHMSHQIGIDSVIDISRDVILSKYINLSQSLNARLTLTTIDKNKHREALKYIENRIKDVITNSSVTKDISNTNTISKTYEELRTEYSQNITAIQNKISSSNDSLIIRSLLFSALTLQEALVKTFITKKIISEEMEISDIIIDKLYDKSIRKKIAHIYFDIPSLDGNYIALRNAMAHNINSTELSEGNQIFNKEPTSDGEKRKLINIDDIFQNLFKFSTEFTEKTLN